MQWHDLCFNECLAEHASLELRKSNESSTCHLCCYSLQSQAAASESLLCNEGNDYQACGKFGRKLYAPVAFTV